MNPGFLIKKFIDGDKTAFEAIHGLFREKLWLYLYNRADNRQDAEDVYNTVCLQVAQSLKTLREPENLIAWVCQIARFRLHDYYRKKLPESRRAKEEEGNFLPDTSPGPHEAMGNNRRRVQIRKCIDALPEPKRVYVQLHYLAELPQKEIARNFDLELNTLKSHLARSRILLANCMRKAGFHSGQ